MEELLSRGYPLQVLAEGNRRWIAAVGLCLPFTIGHDSNPDLTVFGALNIFLLGILLAVMYFKTLRLWLPIGFHLSWNLAQPVLLTRFRREGHKAPCVSALSQDLGAKSYLRYIERANRESADTHSESFPAAERW